MSNTYSKKVRKTVEELNVIDDILFAKIAEDIGAMEELLQTILEDAKLKVIRVTPQKVVKNLQGRSVILDAECILSSGEYVNVEVQKADNDNHERRIRYNTSCLTANITDPGTHFKNVPDVICVYISRFAVHDVGLNLYHISRYIDETGEKVRNGITEVYVNAKYDNNPTIKRLMDLFTIPDYYDNQVFPSLSGRKYQFKETEEGGRIMCEAVQKLIVEQNAELLIRVIEKYMRTARVSLEEACEFAECSVSEYKAAKEYCERNEGA